MGLTALVLAELVLRAVAFRSYAASNAWVPRRGDERSIGVVGVGALVPMCATQRRPPPIGMLCELAMGVSRESNGETYRQLSACQLSRMVYLRLWCGARRWAALQFVKGGEALRCCG